VVERRWVWRLVQSVWVWMIVLLFQSLMNDREKSMLMRRRRRRRRRRMN